MDYGADQNEVRNFSVGTLQGHKTMISVVKLKIMARQS